MGYLIFNSQNISLNMSNCQWDMVYFGFYIMNNQQLSINIDETTISGTNPLLFSENNYLSLFVHDSSIIIDEVDDFDNSMGFFKCWIGIF